MEKNWKRFSVFDMVVIAMLASLGIATKPIVAPVMNAASSLFMLPGGALQSGIFMFWLITARIVTGKTGAATLAALVQGLMVMLVGIMGNHGLLSIITYSMPGLAIDLVYLLPRLSPRMLAMLAGLASCVTAFTIRAELMVHMPLWMLLAGCGVSAVSGLLGGWAAAFVASGLKRFSGRGVV